MTLTVRKAQADDLPTLLEIYANARVFMQTHGNPTQWPASYPGAERLAAEIERGVCRVVMGGGRDSGGVLPCARRRPDLLPYRGRRVAGGRALRNDPPPCVGGKGRRHREILHQLVFAAGAAAARRYPRRQHLHPACAGKLRLCAVRAHLHCRRHPAHRVLSSGTIIKASPAGKPFLFIFRKPSPDC